ncbi:hypothetical protein VPHF86_0076 [Vibrio phage F86]
MYDAASMRERFVSDTAISDARAELQTLLYDTLTSIEKIAHNELDSNFVIPAALYDPFVSDLRSLGYKAIAIKDTFMTTPFGASPFTPEEFRIIECADDDEAKRIVRDQIRNNPKASIQVYVSWRRQK